MWQNASKLTNLYDQGLVGDRVLAVDGIDDVRPTTVTRVARGNTRGVKRPTPSRAVHASAGADSREPLARRMVAYMHDGALCKLRCRTISVMQQASCYSSQLSCTIQVL